MNRKTWLVVGAFMVVAFTAHANVLVDWFAPGGFYWSANENVGILGNGTGNSTIAQLIWSLDGVADRANTDASGHFVTGDDVWLAEITVTEDGIANDATKYDSFALINSVQSFDDSGDMPSGGFIYGRIFQDNAPDAGDWYYVGPIISALDLDPVGDPANGINPDNPQSYNLNRNSAFGDPIDGQNGAQVVVPEPTSLALLAVGAVVIGARRRRK